jgi:hypothetical protein
MKTIAFNPAFLFLIASQFLAPVQAAVTQTAGNASPEQKQSYAIGALLITGWLPIEELQALRDPTIGCNLIWVHRPPVI